MTAPSRTRSPPSPRGASARASRSVKPATEHNRGVDDAVGHPARWRRKRSSSLRKRGRQGCRTVAPSPVPLPIQRVKLCLQPLIRSAGRQPGSPQAATASPRRPHGRWPRAGWHQAPEPARFRHCGVPAPGPAVRACGGGVAPDPPRPARFQGRLFQARPAGRVSSKAREDPCRICRNGGCERHGIRWEPGQTIAAGSLRHSPAPQ